MPGKFALLIGNSAFRHAALARLAAPPNDVRELASLLEDPEIGGFDSVRLKLDVALVDAKAAIGELFANRHPDDLVLFYYSGHGLRDTAGDFYLALTESDPANPDPGSIDESWLRRKMNGSACRRQVIVLDCCHSGALIPDGLTARDAATAPVLTERTLDPSGHGRFILAATTAEASAFEHEGRSLYTRHLVEGLRTGGANPDSERISVQDLHAFVARRVAETTPDLMRPQFWPDPTTDPGPLYIARNTRVRRRLDERVVKALWSEIDSEVEWSVFRLAEIVETDAEGLAADARRVLAERLAQPETLTYAVGDRIRKLLDRTGAMEAAHAYRPQVGKSVKVRRWRVFAVATAGMLVFFLWTLMPQVLQTLRPPADPTATEDTPAPQQRPGTASDVAATPQTFADVSEAAFWREIAAIQGDSEAGERVWRQCQACHQIGPGAQNRVGPHLNDIIARPFAGVGGFRYSEPLRKLAAEGEVWTTPQLKAFVRNPREMVHGTTMAFAGVRDEQDVNNLVAYLARAAVSD